MEVEVINKGLFSGRVYFQHDNAKSHIAILVKEKIPHEPYSPDLAPSGNQLVIKSLSNHMRG
jgi:hypothetical protein